MTTVLEAVAKLEAAKDIGDARGDKERKSAIAQLVKRASVLSGKLSGVEADSFPEVVSALAVVQSLAELSGKLGLLADRLKMAPAASTEAADAQRDLDRMRKNVDSMVRPMDSTMAAMEDLLDAALEMEDTFKKLKDHLALTEEALKHERARLASVAQAVSNAAKIA